MKLYAYSICLLMGLSQNLIAKDSHDAYEAFIKKVWAKHSKCMSSRNRQSVDFFEEKASKCIASNPSYTTDRCDDIAEQQLFEWEDSDGYKDMCEHLRPTTFTRSDDPYGITYVGEPGGMMAANEGKYEIAVKIFSECIEVGNLECTYRLGQIKISGNKSVQDINGGITLLKSAAEKGHSEAIKYLDTLKPKNKIQTKGQRPGSM
ncbi:MAG: hypothetical protein COA42_14390 [Alteromonadaceae bacterium]|nr:MAG: hypothetical protein COA42_14390 [Alteromonadaceae bacterium]